MRLFPATLSPEEQDRRDVERALHGHRRAFSLLMQRHQEVVYRVAASITGDKEDALDLAQEVFLSAFRNLRSLHRADRFRPWLLQIARRRASNWRRSRARRPTESLFDVDVLDEHQIQPDQAMLQQQIDENLDLALAELSEKARLAIKLRYFEERPIREIAGQLDATEGTVRNLLYRSLKRLRSALEKD